MAIGYEEKTIFNARVFCIQGYRIQLDATGVSRNQQAVSSAPSLRLKKNSNTESVSESERSSLPVCRAKARKSFAAWASVATNSGLLEPARVKVFERQQRRRYVHGRKVSLIGLS
jgi:hypothetical protein